MASDIWKDELFRPQNPPEIVDIFLFLRLAIFFLAFSEATLQPFC